MEQLKMRWANDHKPASELNIPDGCEIKRFTELDGALDAWLDIVQYGLSDGRKDADFYGSLMLDWPDYSEDKNFFIVSDGEPAATLTVVCHPENMEGYIHMVACKEKFRGRGFGTLLNNLALKVLKDEGMETAYLTTDDWRIPAIKSYLSAGFVPVIPDGDMDARWKAVFEKINSK